MERHVKRLGILYLVFGGLGLVTAFCGAWLITLFMPLLQLPPMMGDQSTSPMVMLSGAVALLSIAFGLSGVIAGVGLLKRTSWARYLTLGVSGVALLNVPFGTALGLYAFWVLRKPEAARLFASST